MRETEQRRSERILIDVPVVVSGGSANDGAFREETFTLTISPYGASLMLSTAVALGQVLTVRNPLNEEQQEARVAYKGTVHAGLAQVGIEFLSESPDFWPLNPPYTA